MDVYTKKELKAYIANLKSTFNVVRLVNPEEKKMYLTEDIDNKTSEISCYSYWKKGEQCDNCISFHAVKEDRTITKMEYNQDIAFLAIATPIIVENKKYAIEMLLDINDIDTIVNLNKENSKKVERVIFNLKENLLLDELTGIYNRRFINKNLQVDLEHGKAKGIDKMAVIMTDIDNFKQINDTYGHLVGDEALKKVANIIKSRIRNGFDWVARFGGDEFIILLKNADEIIANNVIKEIQRTVEDSNIISSNPEVKITLSFGIHILEPGTMNYEKVIEIIDKNLNRAKATGKNSAIMS